jgi:hypothetical protein
MLSNQKRYVVSVENKSIIREPRNTIHTRNLLLHIVKHKEDLITRLNNIFKFKKINN